MFDLQHLLRNSAFYERSIASMSYLALAQTLPNRGRFLAGLDDGIGSRMSRTRRCSQVSAKGMMREDDMDDPQNILHKGGLTVLCGERVGWGNGQAWHAVTSGYIIWWQIWWHENDGVDAKYSPHSIEENYYINVAYVCFRNIPIRRTRAQNLKVGKGEVGQLQADASAQNLANEHEKLKNASPRRSQRLKPQRAQHVQGRARKEPSCATPDYETIVPVGSGVPETAMQNGTKNAQPSIKQKVSDAKMMKSHTHSHSVTATAHTGSKEITRPAFKQGKNVDGQNMHHPSHQGVGFTVYPITPQKVQWGRNGGLI
ncbi:hypothetical protein C8J57DRAFT_1238829 [Mycena rebaudengoi]|nr:hypothetical protein C8J57DRAFT_1238829 [Mycena rebaudengoi]